MIFSIQLTYEALDEAAAEQVRTEIEHAVEPLSSAGPVQRREGGAMTSQQQAAIRDLHFTVISEEPSGVLIVKGVNGTYALDRGGLLRPAQKACGWQR